MSPRRPTLCLVTDRRSARSPLPSLVAAAVRGGVDWVQVREKDLDGAALLALVREIAASARAVNPAVRVIVNRRIDVALAAGASGAQLGFDALPPREARALLGARALIGASAHDHAEVLAAARAGADYALLAPIFAPFSKPQSREPLGLGVLREACERASIPVLAQGGIDAQRAGACIAAGAAGVAVTGEICSAADPERAARALRAALDAATRLS
ncbi:MAG TPA: thiamine phosphate synthase [Myxococcota bacterium]